jgi:hypothetical protein
MIGHGAASKRLCQSRYSRAVSQSCLVFNIDQSQGTEQCLIKPAFLIIHGRTAHGRHIGNPVDNFSVVILGNKIVIPGFFNTPGMVFSSSKCRGEFIEGSVLVRKKNR